MFFKRRQIRYTLDERSSRQDKRVQVVRHTLPLFSIILIISQFLLLALLCFKPWEELRQLEQQRSFTQNKLDRARVALKQAKQEYIWMSQDAKYFEMIARDKNNLSLPNEQIIRIEEPQKLN